MSTIGTTPAPHGHDEHAEPAAAPRFGWSELGWLTLVVLVGIAAARLLDAAIPVLIAAAVAASLPRKHGWDIKLPLAVIAGILALFVVRAWPVTGELPEAPPPEPTTILSWLIGLPIAGAVAILFLPRQAPRVLRGVTMGVMFATIALDDPAPQRDDGAHLPLQPGRPLDGVASASATTSRSTGSRCGS